MTPRAAPAVNVEILREREARIASTLRQIDRHLTGLQSAKSQRVAALAKIRAELVLAEGPAAPDPCAD